MSDRTSNEASAGARANYAFARSSIKPWEGQGYLLVLLLFGLTFLFVSPSANLDSNNQLWFLGALSVALGYTFGFYGLCIALALTLGSNIFNEQSISILQHISELLFIASISILVLLPYEQRRTHQYERRKRHRDTTNSVAPSMLSNSKSSSHFILLTHVASLISVGLYQLTIQIGSDAPDIHLALFIPQVLASAIFLICLCPSLTAWKQKHAWPRLPLHARESAAWCIALVLICFLAIAFGRYWLSLCALLVVWATLRSNWFGFTLALSVTTLIVLPSTRTLPSDAPDAFVANWLFVNFEYVSWFFVSATSLYFASMLSDQRRIERHLEDRVLVRTQELDTVNEELRSEIESRKTAEHALQKTNKRYRALIETAGIPVIVINNQHLIEHWNAAAEACSGFQYETILGQNFLQRFIPKQQHESFIWRLNKTAVSGTHQENVESGLKTSTDAVLSMLWNINYIADEELEEHGQFLLIGQDISSIRKTQDQLHYLAHFDSLTGAANRRLFEDRCSQSIERAKRSNTPLALISIDIDHFKKINDSLGHDAGDAFLRELVRRFEHSVRKEDTVARLGGDEFAVLLPNVSGREGAEVVARNILENITTPIMIKGNELVITSSMGITLCPADGSNYEQLLKNADMAMYRAKDAGRNNMQFYCEEMNNEMKRQIEIEGDLRIALREEQFELHYQPIIDTKSGEVVALEALTRWNKPGYGLVMPKDFLSVADQTGLVQQIGEWSINQICTEGAILTGSYAQELPIAINLTRKQYQHPTLLKTLSDACENHRFNPKKLIIELSESALSAADEHTLKRLRKLKKFGCLIAIDSFGTGTSSVNQLNALPIDIIKIDRSLIAGCLQQKEQKIIVETLLSIAKQLGIKTFASGVETLEQEAFLQKNHCHFAQGFLYSKALSLEPLLTYLNAPKSQDDGQRGDQITLPFA